MQNFKISFEQWCLENNRQDILDRWDYDKTDFAPSDIGYASEKKVWFRCPNNLHESELYSICNVHNNNSKLICRKCNSFAQWVINKYSKDYLNKIWSDKNTFSPWELSFSSRKKIILNIDGIEKETTPEHFIKPTTKIPVNDKTVKRDKSLAISHPEVIDIWSDKNEKTPYDYWANSDAVVWWKCENGVHEDYERRISSSRVAHYKCPRCGRLGAGLIDLTGNTYGELTVISYDKSIDDVPYWNCRCSCGVERSVRGSLLRGGHIKTCGAGYHFAKENNPNWKGGEKTLNQRMRSSKPYKNWRDKVLEKYGSNSLITGLPIENPDMHHIYPVCDYFEYMTEEWNLVPLEKELHHMMLPTGFHYIYRSKHNTPEQLEEFINIKRKEFGIDEPFDIYKFIEERKELAKIDPIPKPNLSYYLDQLDKENGKGNRLTITENNMEINIENEDNTNPTTNHSITSWDQWQFGLSVLNCPCSNPDSHNKFVYIKPIISQVKEEYKSCRN